MKNIINYRYYKILSNANMFLHNVCIGAAKAKEKKKKGQRKNQQKVKKCYIKLHYMLCMLCYLLLTKMATSFLLSMPSNPPNTIAREPP